MARLDRQFEEDLKRDIIDYIRDRAPNDPGFDELDLQIGESRNAIYTLIDAAAQVYEYYMEDVHRGKDTNWCYDEAISYVCDVKRAAIINRDRRLQQKYSDKELDGIEDLLDEHASNSADMKDYFRDGPRGARNDRYRGNRDDRQGGRSRDRNRRDNRRDDRSIWRDGNDSNRSSRDRRDTDDGADARARALNARQQKEEEKREERRLPSRLRNQQQEDGLQRQMDRKVEMLTSLKEALSKPQQDDFIAVPYYVPQTQRLKASVDKAGKVEYEVMEMKDMHPEDHKHVIRTMMDRYQDKRFENPQEKTVRYIVDGIELPTSMVENERVDAILQEMVDRKEIKENVLFNDLPEETKRTIIQEATRRYEFEAAQSRAEERAKRIENGDMSEEKVIEIYPMQLTNDKFNSITAAIQAARISYGAGIKSPLDKNIGYSAKVSVIGIEHTFSNPSECRVQLQLLTGLFQRSATIQKIAMSLAERSIDADLRIKLNERCTSACNEGLRYIFKLPNISMDSFVDDINDFAEFIQGKQERGELSKAQVDLFNQYVCRENAKLVRTDAHRLHQYYPEKSLEVAHELMLTSAIMNEDAVLTFLPYLSVELGLTTEHNLINIDSVNTPLLSTLFRNVVPSSTTYIITSDDKVYKVTQTNTVEYLLTEVPY